MLAVISLIFSKLSENPFDLIKIIGIFALSAQKILPLFQQAYGGLSQIQSQFSAVESFLELIKKPKINILNKKENLKYHFKKNINFKNIYFRYQDNSQYVFKDLNLLIKKGQKVGVIGGTGSGKTTLINILLGLIKPDKGTLFIDNYDLYAPKNIENLNSWRQIISYVPQNFFLLIIQFQETLLFQTIQRIFNSKKMDRATEASCSIQFIKSLPNKYNTCVGEDGAFLSQGQKQRIAIARALYKEPKILILDEATSSLDEKTEKGYLINS